MIYKEGKYTIETFARKQGIQRQSAINLMSKLKEKGLTKTTGGGKQKRIYTLSNKPFVKTNGFYDVVNKYSEEKLVPKFDHKVFGNYTIEHAIIDGIQINDVRTQQATMSLFNHVKNWKRLLDLAKEKRIEKKVIQLYKKARKRMKCRKMPARYLK